MSAQRLRRTLGAVSDCILEHFRGADLDRLLEPLTKGRTRADQTRTKAMSETRIPVGLGHTDENADHERGRGARSAHRLASLIAGGILCVVAVVFVAGGGLVLWKDRADRDAMGFVSFGTEQLQTEQYAIVGDLRGDGPGWLYGSTVLGDTRIRATSAAEQPLFIGIARKEDVLRYLNGAGYATIYSFEVTADTTHPGGAPSGPPATESIWAASTQGAGQQTLLWKPRAGDWSVVFINADASANVDVRGDASAKLPVLPWLAGALLIIGAAAGALAAWILVRANRRSVRSVQADPDTSRESTSGGQPGAAHH
jgi:hypothetical protein